MALLKMGAMELCFTMLEYVGWDNVLAKVTKRKQHTRGLSTLTMPLYLRVHRMGAVWPPVRHRHSPHPAPRKKHQPPNKQYQTNVAQTLRENTDDADAHWVQGAPQAP